ncbi:MAG: hypothetical protein LBR72_02515 [Oscillospiraceae bacterium]|jgi:hypothetical protein|nr:hypothetical protein [Oscillospiraceae bacterium]
MLPFKKARCVLLSFLFLLTTAVFAVDSDTLATDKTAYTVGEEILVTAVGSDKDWVGLYVAGEVPSGPESIWWYYVAGDGNTSGTAKPLQKAEYSNPSRADLHGIPAGEYTVFLCANDGYEVLSSVNITVSEASAEPAAPTGSAPANPKTGDVTYLLIPGILLLAAVIAVLQKKRKNA